MRALIFKITPSTLTLKSVPEYSKETLDYLTKTSGMHNLQWEYYDSALVFYGDNNDVAENLFWFLETISFHYDIEIV